MANGLDSDELLVSENVDKGLKRDFPFDSDFKPKSCGEDESEGLGNKKLKKLTVAEDVMEKVVSDVEDGKSDVVDWLSEDELINGVTELEKVEEMNDKVSNVVEMMEFNTYDDEPTSNLVEPPTIEDVKDYETTVEKVKMNGGEFLSNDDSSKDGVESLCEVGDTKEWIISLEKPRKRVTRSALKAKAIPVARRLLDMERTEEAPMECVAGEEDGVGCPSHVISPERKVETVFTPSVLAKLLPNFPKKLKDFLDTNILQGAPVRYIRGSKSRGISETGLPGIIRGSGILCFCKECKGVNVVSPNLFEIHAGSGNKRPPEYIQLDNGRTLRDVMNACKNASPNTMEKSFQDVISGSSVKTAYSTAGSIAEAGPASSKWIGHLCESKDDDTQASITHTTQTDNADERSSSSSVPKSSKKVSSHGSSRSKSKGRITKKFLELHKAVFSSEDGLKEGTEVRYMINSQIMLVGKKKGFRICCSCCDSVVSPSMFEAHAGYASRRKPFQNIFDLYGKSLHEVGEDIESKQSTKDNDDCRTLCSRGGDLMCCDACPRAFHIECVSLQRRPTEKWFCKKCLNERGVSSSRQASSNYSRIAKNPPANIGGCVICRSPHFSNSDFGPQTVMLCDQCEQEYHVGCLRERGIQDLQELPEDLWFCSEDCGKIHSTLNELDSEGEKELSESLLNIIRQKHDEESRLNLDVTWRLVRGKIASEKCKLLLTEAVGIFRDRFGLIPDTAPGPSSSPRPDLIPAMVRGEKLRDRDFGGMYCALLTVNSIVVCGLLVRIYGQELAEVPLVATGYKHEGKGYFRALFSCIEHLLGSMDVKTIVLPAADEAESIWLGNFGFTRMTDGELEKYSTHHDLMTFQGISWLKKAVPPCSL